jgi:APA family basic amino acid/polyamine antiporter
MEKNESQLNRTFGFWSTLSVVVGTVIGTGIFFKQGRILSEAGNSTNAILVWIVAGLISLSGALTLAELSSRITKTGGLYSYLEETYGKFWGFLAGWMQVIFYGPALISAVSYFGATLLLQLFGIDEKYAVATALGLIVFLTLINLLENKVSEKISLLTTSIKLIPIIAIIVFGLFFGHQHALGQTVTVISSSANGSGFGVAMLSALFAYDGWVVAASIGGEIKNPGRTLPRALSIGMIFVLLVYVLISFGILKALPANEITKYDNLAPFHIINSAFGSLAGRLVNIAVFISIIGTLNSKILAFPRIMFEMADNGNFIFPNTFNKLGKRTKSPFVATIFIGFIASFMLLVAGAQDLSDWAILLTYIFYIFAFIAVFILRKRYKNDPKPEYTVPLFPVVPLIAIIGSFYIVVSTLISSFNNIQELIGTLLSIGVVLFGIPVYYWIHQSKQSTKKDL